MILYLRNVPECGRDSPPAVLGAEKRLRDLEKQAWNAYSGIARTLDSPDTAKTTDEFLTTNIMPVFKKIGLDEAFIEMLFGLASKAWGTLGITSKKVVRLHSNMRRDIDEVKQGLLFQADRKMAIPSGPTFLTPRERYGRLMAYMDPANLYQLIDEVTTSWIILPRAYILLQRDHVNYLPAYLEMIDNETNEVVLHTFTRIAIEFLANFTIRFADERYSREQVVRLVIAGYTALFWKNLNTPPRGFEDIRIFEHFLAWLKYSGCLAKKTTHDLTATIKDMETRKAAIFPAESDLINSKKECPDVSGFMVALRHGCIGIDSTVRYFWLTPAGTHLPEGRAVRWSIIVFSLKSLFKQITCQYGEESKRTRYYIREFLFQLKNTYAYSVLHKTTTGKQKRADMQCLRSKIMAMVQKLQHTLSILTP